MATMRGISLCNESPTPFYQGVASASWSGVLQYFIQAVSVNPTPMSNTIAFICTTPAFSFIANPLSNDDAQASKPSYNVLQYTQNSLEDLLSGPDYDFLNNVDTLTCEAQIIVPTKNNIVYLVCPRGKVSYCQVTWKRASTPLLYFLSPQVLYSGSETSLHVDKASSNSLSGATSNPNGKVDGTNLDFLGRSPNDNVVVINNDGLYNEIEAYSNDQQPKAQSNVVLTLTAGQAFHMPSMTTCLPDGTCYEAKTVPRIDSISTNSTSADGFEVVTITGHGFLGVDPTVVKIGPNECLIQSLTNTEIECMTQPGAAPTLDGFYIGSNGIKRRIYSDGVNQPGFTNFQNFPIVDAQLYTTTESQINQRDRYVAQYEGLFVPMVSGGHRFFCAADDNCQVYLSTDIDPAHKQQIINSAGATGYRSFNVRASQSSAFITLQQGTPYYFQILHQEGTGNDYVSVGVEIESSNTNHHQCVRECQNLRINQQQDNDIFKWTINKPDKKFYRLNFKNSNKVGSAMESAGVDCDFQTNHTAAQISSIITSCICSPYYASSCRATKVMYNINNTVTTNEDDCVRTEVQVQVLRALPYDAVTGIDTSHLPVGLTISKSRVDVLPSAYNGAHMKALGGYFQIQCFNEDGSSAWSEPMSVTASLASIQERIFRACPQYRRKIEIYEGSTYQYINNGRDLKLCFNVDRDVQQFQIRSAVGPFSIAGNYPGISGYNSNCTQDTPSPYSSNYYYPSIPFEMLHTLETQQQLTVSVGNLPAVCTTVDLSCTVITTPGFGGGFGGGGQQSALNITAIDPINLNPLGGQQFEITGENIPTDQFDNTTVVFQDGTTCTVTYVDDTTILCTTNHFTNYPATQRVTICVGAACNNLFTVNVLGFGPKILDYSPRIVSPVLRTDITLNFQDLSVLPAGIIDWSLFDIYYYSVTDPSIKELPVPQSIDVVNNKIVIRFLGALPGPYQLHFNHQNLGTFDVSALPNLDVNAYIYSFTPLSGSPYGGTKITITGEPFSAATGPYQSVSWNTLDNNVIIGDTDCIVSYSSHDTIICTTAPRIPNPAVNPPDVTNELEVILKVAEYAVCSFTSNPTCGFTYTTTGLPTVNSITPIWDTSSYRYYAQISGTGFTVDGVPPTLSFDNHNHPIPNDASHFTDSQIYTQMIWLNATSTFNVDLLFAAGRPQGISNLQSGFSLEPKLVELDINVGSEGGSNITAIVRGVGVETQNINLIKQSNGQALCDSLYIYDFEHILCHTKAGVIATPENIQFTMTTNGVTTVYSCVNADTTKCQYSTATPPTPHISSQSIDFTNNLISFHSSSSLANYASGWTINCRFATIYGSSGAFVSNNEVTCHYDLGVPHNNQPEYPILWFSKVGSTVVHWAVFDTKLSNPNPVYSVVHQSCSFHGGCPLIIQGQGLSSDLLNPAHANVTICGKLCEFDSTHINTTSQQAVCWIDGAPSLPDSAGATPVPAGFARMLGSNKDDSKSKCSEDDDKKKKKDDNEHDDDDDDCGHGEECDDLNEHGEVKGSHQEGAEKCFHDDRDEVKKQCDKKNDEKDKNTENCGKESKSCKKNDREKDKNDECKEKEKEKKKKEKEDKDDENCDLSDGWTDPKGNCWMGISYKKCFQGQLSKVRFFIPSFTNPALIKGLKFQGSHDNTTWTTLHTVGNEVRHHQNWIKFPKGARPAFRFYRFFGTATNSCLVTKVKLYGKVAYNKDSCEPKEHKCCDPNFEICPCKPEHDPTCTICNPLHPNYTAGNPACDVCNPNSTVYNASDPKCDVCNPLNANYVVGNPACDICNPLNPAYDPLNPTCPPPCLFDCPFGDVLCDVKVEVDGYTEDLGFGVSYQESQTATCSDISPRYGVVFGGEEVTITGTNFSPNIEDYVIFFDSVQCQVIAANTTAVTCITGNRFFIFDNPYMTFRINGMGDVICPYQFRYVFRWSDERTWEGDGLPRPYDSLWIPKGRPLLVDLDFPPPLKEVVVEGELIFENKPLALCPDTPRTFDAHYIFTLGGLIEVGTEAEPFNCCMTITLHGARSDPEIPLYGNKVLGVRYGTLDLHGQPRSLVWTELATTAHAGDTVITLLDDVSAAWHVGDQIVLASTSYDLNEAETATIASISGASVTLTAALAFNHYSALESYHGGAYQAEIRGEVGLLTRCLVIQGDEHSPADQNGAIVTIYSNGDDSSIGRIENVEFRQVGQAYKVGRYPLHFYVIGSLSKSYIRSNSIHHSYNRAVAFHGVTDFRVQDNVAYEIMGHAIFLQEGTERYNTITGNLVVNTRISWSLLVTDQTPSAFWIRNPLNTFKNNRAAGSEGHGFWFHLPTQPEGAAYVTSVCPQGTKLGQFFNNKAHSNARSGLLVQKPFNPRQNGCLPINTNVLDLVNYNPTVTAVFEQFSSWKNKENGVYAESVGDVKFVNFMVADNLMSGIEVAQTPYTPDGTAEIQNAVVIGLSGNAESLTTSYPSRGIVTPRSENFQVNGAYFSGFNTNSRVSIQPCSGCDQGDVYADSGARTVTFSGLVFDDYVQRVIYIYPFRDILYDLDGSLTGLGPKSWATPYWIHNVQNGCQVTNVEWDNGIICDNTVTVRRIAFYNYQPTIFHWVDVRVLKSDGLEALPHNIDYNYYDNTTSDYSMLPWTRYRNPEMSWAIPFVCGHTYKVHWRNGLDFTQMSIDVSERWNNLDHNLYLIFNHTDVRETIKVKVTNLSPAEQIPTDSLISKPPATWQSGDNALFNDTNIRQIHLVINGQNMTRKTITIYAYRCLLYCPLPASNYGNGGGSNFVCADSTYRYWSNPAHWYNGRVPTEGDEVWIPLGCIYVFDVPTTPVLSSVTVLGTLIWKNWVTGNFNAYDSTLSLQMNTKYLFNRGGTIHIGTSSSDRFQGVLAEIQLQGSKFDQYVAYSPTIEGGNKGILNAGTLTMFGKTRTRISRLLAPANAGQDAILLQPGLNLVANERIAILTTNNNWKASEDAFIKTYNNVNGQATLKANLKFYHWGAATSTAADYQGKVDIRAEVLLLTSNVRVTAATIDDDWGCQIVTSDFQESHGPFRAGQLSADNIEAYNCSQYDTFKAALRFEGHLTQSSFVTNSAFHHGLGKGLQVLNSDNVLLQGNVFYDFIQFGGNVQTSNYISLIGNVFAHIGYRELTGSITSYIRPNGGLLICAYKKNDVCTNNIVQQNIVAGAFYAGYGLPGVRCDLMGDQIKENVAHSNNGDGAIFFPDPNVPEQATCMMAHKYYAYKNTGHGAISYAAVDKLVYQDMVLIDNRFGSAMMIGKEGDNLFIQQSNIYYYGESPEHKDCATQNSCTGDNCLSKAGLILPIFTVGANQPFSLTTEPFNRIFTDASWGGQTLLQQVHFINFPTNQQYCGGRLSLFETHQGAADYTPEVRFIDPEFYNVNYQALGYFNSPLAEWAVVERCGNFPCTGPNNVIVSFQDYTTNDAELFGISLSNHFSLVSYNSNHSVGATEGCSARYAQFNGHICNVPDFGHLIFESQDQDRRDRIFSPLIVESPQDPAYQNTLNTFMDKGATLLTGQSRLSRFATNIIAPTSASVPTYYYNLTYTGTVPKWQRFSLRNLEHPIAVHIKYGEQNSYTVANANTPSTVIPSNDWSDAIMAQGPLTGTKGCGENRYVGGTNILEFTLTPLCTVLIRNRDVILASAIRMDWTLDEFFSTGGTTLFIDRLSNLLGIKPKDIKIVGISMGSIILNFQVTADDVDNEDAGYSQLQTVQGKLSDLLTSNSTALGAPILDVSTTLPKRASSKPTVVSEDTSSASEEVQTSAGGLSSTQLTTVLVVCSVVVVAIAVVGVIMWCALKKQKAVAIRVNETKVADPSRKNKDELDLSQEYETQYHPKRDIFNKGKDTQEELDDVNIEVPNSQRDDWKEDWEDKVNTGRPMINMPDDSSPRQHIIVRDNQRKAVPQGSLSEKVSP